MAPIEDGTNWIVTTTKAMDAVRTALVLVRAEPRPGDNRVTPTQIRKLNVTAETDMMHMTAELAPLATMGSALPDTTTIMDAMDITAVTAHGHAVEADALRVTR